MTIFVTMKTLANADIIKAKFIDYILNDGFITNPRNLCIGQEVMYGSNKMFADMVIVSNDKLYAIEIKAQNDNLRRLENQLSNYKQIFDYVFVIVTKNHLEELKKLPATFFGILVIDENAQFEQIRQARVIKKISKKEVLETMPATYLKSYFTVKGNFNADHLRFNLVKQPINRLKAALLNYMESKILYKYENFLGEKGKFAHYEDISILSLRNYSIMK